MPDWTKIAQTIAQGEYGEDWDKAKLRKSELQDAEQRRALLNSAETRAQSEEQRRASDQRFQESQRPMLMEKLQEEVKAGRLSNANAEKLLNDFDRRVQREKDQDKRDETRLGYEGQRVKNEGQQLGLQGAQYLLNKRKAEQEMEQDSELQPFRVASAENASDPRQKYAADINALSSVYQAAVRNGDEETAKKVEASLSRLAAQQEAESIAWNQRRNARINPGGNEKPQGGAGAWNNAPKGPAFDTKATPDIVRPQVQSGWTGSSAPLLQNAIEELKRRIAGGDNASSEGS